MHNFISLYILYLTLFQYTITIKASTSISNLDDITSLFNSTQETSSTSTLSQFYTSIGIDLNTTTSKTIAVNSEVELELEITPQRYRNFLNPFYSLSQFFLGSIVQPKTLDSLSEDIDIVSSVDAFLESFQTDTSEWLKYFIGYVVLLSVGIICMIAVPITGCIICCCRCCCKKCCVVKDDIDPACAKYKRICCGTFLLVFVVIIIFGSILSILASLELWHETKQDSGALYQINAYLNHFEEYTDNTVAEIDETITEDFRKASEDIDSDISGLGETSLSVLGNVTNLDTLLNRLANFAYDIEELHQLLQESQSIQNSLSLNSSLLETELLTLQSDVTASTSLCTGFENECVISEDMASSLANIIPDYSSLQDLSTAISSINLLILNDAEGKINESITLYNSIATIVNSTYASEIAYAEGELDRISGLITRYIDQMNDYLQQFNISNLTSTISSAESDVSKYGDIWFYVNISCISIVILICLLYLAGLLSSVCCALPSVDKSATCTTRTASCCYLSGAVITFLTTTVILLLMTLMFLSGGPIYTEVCRHMVNINQSSSIDVIDELILNSFGANISVKTLISNCQNDEAIYTALDLENKGINVTELLDIDQYDLNSILDTFKSVDISLGTYTFLTKEMNDTLLVAASGLDSIDEELYFSVLSQSVTSVDLLTFADQLNKTAEVLSIASLASDFRLYAVKSRELYYQYVIYMEAGQYSLNDSINSIVTIREAADINNLVVELTYAQNILNSNGDALIQGIVNETVDGVYDTLDSTLKATDYSIRYEIGQCKPVYTTIDGLVTVSCEDILDPWNLVWFWQGLSIIMFIPCLALSMELSKLYSKSRRRHAISSEEGYLSTSFVSDSNLNQERDNLASNDQSYFRKVELIEMMETRQNTPISIEDDLISITSDTSSISEAMMLSTSKLPLIRPASSVSQHNRRPMSSASSSSLPHVPTLTQDEYEDMKKRRRTPGSAQSSASRRSQQGTKKCNKKELVDFFEIFT